MTPPTGNGNSPMRQQGAASGSPRVSIIIPCRNEAGFIAQCLDSLLGNGFPQDELEILVVDGMSADGTRKIVEGYASHHPVRLLDNPKRVTPCALNIGIRHAKGKIIMRVDAHSSFAPNYIANCVNALETHRADDVGGLWRIRPRAETLIGRSIAKAISHPFGVGNVRYRFSAPTSPVEVDTVPFFCCAREVFDRVGLFNEKLTRIQDQEFNTRLVRAGGKILLVPSAVSYYMVRSDLRSFWKHNWDDGVWSILAFAYSDVMPVCLRHLVPPAFAIAIVLSLLLALLGVRFWPLLAVGGTYAVASAAASAGVALQKRDFRYFMTMPLVFGLLHLGRGLGSTWGIVRLANERRLGHAFGLLILRRPAAR
jgi:glycosyltransferase involved in cell wall biosynthesis